MCAGRDPLIADLRVDHHSGNRAQLERTGPPCSQAAPRTTEQNNTKIAMYTLQDPVTIRQFALSPSVRVCVCVVQLCVFLVPMRSFL